jgi:hypothetical protein
MAAIGQLGVLAVMETFRQRHHLVAMAHPHVQIPGAVVDIGEEGVFLFDLHFGITEFTQVGGADLAAQLLGHGLHAVADAQHRQPELEHDFGARGEPASVTDSGPPDRMMPFGLKARISSSVAS